MPTNSERREVAARLRKLAQESARCGDDGVDERACRVLLGPSFDLLDVVDAHFALARLADLIEPEERTCRNIASETDREWGNPFICSECGADPHDAESYYCGFSSGEHDWRFCPNCGAKVLQE